MIAPLRVVSVLSDTKVPFVVTGDHALSVWTEETFAAKSLEVLVPRRYHRKAAGGIQAAFGKLDVIDCVWGKKLIAAKGQTGVVSIHRPVDKLRGRMFRHTLTIRGKYGAYRIPSLEMMLALNYASIVSLYQSGCMKYRDTFVFALLLRRHPNFDRDKLRMLGDLIYRGGGAGIRKFAQSVQAGEKPVL